MKNNILPRSFLRPLSLKRLAGILRGRSGLFWGFAICTALTEAPVCKAAVTYDSPYLLQQAAYDLSGTKVKLSFAVLHYDLYPSPVMLSNIVFNGRYFALHAAFSQVYLNNYDSDVPLNIHFPSGARAFGAFFSSWIGPQFASFTGTVRTDQGDRFVVQGPTDSGSGEPPYLGLLFSDPVYDITFDDGAVFDSGGYKMHEEMVADIFAVLNPAPSLTIRRLLSGALNIQVDGSFGQTVVLLNSTNLTDWHSIVTNKLTSSLWLFTATTTQAPSNEFFMLKLQ